jgi:transcriptional regulator with XRE-family HTH domain
MDEQIISENIKTLRTQKKMTLEKLAGLTGLNKGYLSKIERSKKAPPYSTLNKIAMALNVDAALLLGERLDKSKDTKISFTKKGEGKFVNIMNSLAEGSLYGYVYEALAADKPGKNMEPYIIEPSFEEDAVFQHDGEEFMYVIEGRHLHVYDGKEFIMEQGDCIYFDASVPHTGRSLGNKKAKLLTVLFHYKRI